MLPSLTAAFTEETPQREFALGDVISAYSGVLFSEESQQASDDIWYFLTGNSVWEENAVFRRMLDAQFPYLAGMMGELYKIQRHEKSSEALATWLNNQCDIHGKTVMLRQLYVDVSVPAYDTVSFPATGLRLDITT